MQPEEVVAEEENGARDLVQRQRCRDNNVGVVELRAARVPRVQSAAKVEDWKGEGKGF